jgi:hypothetical protein
MTFSFGQSEEELIEIDVLHYERRASGEYGDDNWLTTEIRVHAGCFHGKISAAIITSEFTRFLPQLRELHEKLTGKAEFRTLEGQLSLTLMGDGRGHIELEGEVLDKAGIGNRLNFHLQLDQTHLAKSIRDLEGIIVKFPVRSI